jgi:hypothetical protein
MKRNQTGISHNPTDPVPDNLTINITEELKVKVLALYPIGIPIPCSVAGCPAIQDPPKPSTMLVAMAIAEALPSGAKITYYGDDGWAVLLRWEGCADGYYCPKHAQAIESFSGVE